MRNNEKNASIFRVREWIATFLATALIVYEAVGEHSAHREVYGVALILYGFVPFSLVDRILGRWVEPPKGDS